MVEFDAGDGISVLVLVNGVFALTLGVPDLDLVIKTTSHELSVISRDGNGVDILVVADELLNCLACGDVPETN